MSFIMILKHGMKKTVYHLQMLSVLLGVPSLLSLSPRKSLVLQYARIEDNLRNHLSKI